MNRKLTLYIVLLGLIIGLIILIDAMAPKPIDWKPTYASKDKIPFGLYVFDKEAPALFKDNEVKKFSITPYEFFDNEYNYDDQDYDVSGSFININENQADLDSESVNELLYFAEYGNTVFLSMKDFPGKLLDTLKVTAETSFFLKDSVALSLANTKKKFWFNEGAGFTYFKSVDTLNTAILGSQTVKDEKLANFIQVKYGNGTILLHTQPATFTNFYLLKDNHHEYAETILSHLPKETVYWYEKRFAGEVSSSPLRYALNQPGLKWAIYFGLISFFIFALFNAKRKQRIVPEIHPLKNTTVDFTKTIGNLYYQEGNHHTIIEKKIIYFLEHIRNEYLIDTYSLDDEFVEKLHLKTGKPKEEIQKTVSLIKKHRHQFQSTEADVIEINKAIEKLRL